MRDPTAPVPLADSMAVWIGFTVPSRGAILRKALHVQ
jgi:hypothetical protein